MSRPLTLTDDARAILVAGVRDGLPMHACCRLARIGKRTHYNWMRRGDMGEEPFKAYADEIRKAQAERKQDLVQLVRSHAVEDPQTARYLLACSEPAMYGKEGKEPDAMEEAYENATEEEVVDMFANDPRVQAKVAELMAAKALEAGDDDE